MQTKYIVYLKGVGVAVPVGIYLLKPSFWLVYKSAVFARDLIISVMLYSRIQHPSTTVLGGVDSMRSEISQSVIMAMWPSVAPAGYQYGCCTKK